VILASSVHRALQAQSGQMDCQAQWDPVDHPALRGRQELLALSDPLVCLAQQGRLVCRAQVGRQVSRELKEVLGLLVQLVQVVPVEYRDRLAPQDPQVVPGPLVSRGPVGRLVPADQWDLQDQLVFRERMVHLVRQGLLVNPVHREHKACPVPLDLLVQLELQVHLEHWVRQAPLVRLEPRVL